MAADVTTISAARALDVLPERLGGAWVLSMYLDADARRIDQEAWMTGLHRRCHEARHGLVDATAGFDEATRVADLYLRRAVDRSHPGLALFVTPRLGGYAVPLPYRPVEGVRWTRGPQIEPLVATIDEFERFAVVLIGEEETRLYTVFLREIEERRSIEDELPPCQVPAAWFGLSQARFRHTTGEDRVIHRVNRTIDALLDLRQDYPFDRLLIAGSERSASVLRRMLPPTLRSRVAGRLDLDHEATDDEVLRAALSVAEQIERAYELEAVKDLLGAIGLQHAAVGLNATLEALGNRRLHQLILSEAFASSGERCTLCHRLQPRGARCPWCEGASATPVDDLREEMVRAAREQGAMIEIVRGEAAARLDAHGGVGGWLRN